LLANVDLAADEAGTRGSGCRPRSVGRSRGKGGASEVADQPGGLGLILDPVHGHGERDHRVDPGRGVAASGVGDPRSALSLLGDRGGDIGVEHRPSSIGPAARPAPPISTSLSVASSAAATSSASGASGEAGVALDAVERPFRTQHPLGVVVNRPSLWPDR
jgi:hypothetical protein